MSVRKRKKVKPTSVILSKAKRLACQHMPYLAALLYTARTIETPKVGTMAVDAAGRLYINPQFVQKLSVKNCAFILLHEMLHIALSHAKRRATRIPQPTPKQCELWNIAADISINGILQRDCRELTPSFGVFVTQFAHIKGMVGGLSTEQYYELLLAEEEKPKPKPPTQPQPKSDDDEDEDEDYEDGDMSDEDEDGEPQSGGDESDEDDDEDGDRTTGGDQFGNQGEDEDFEPADGEPSDGDGEPSDEPDGNQDGASGKDDKPNDQPLEPVHSGSNSDGMPRDYEPDMSMAESLGQEGKLSEVEEAIKEHESSGIGTAPGELKQSLEVRLRPQPDPFDTLRSLVSRSVASPVGTPFSTFRKISRRQQSDMPRRRGDSRLSPECVVVVDTSGSMECDDYKDRALVAVAQGLKRVHRPRIITCDAAIHSDKKIESLKKFQWEGGGGTDMTLAITHADSAHQPDAIVVITDGGTCWPQTKTRARLVIAMVAPRRDWFGVPPEWAKVVDCTAERRGHAG